MWFNLLWSSVFSKNQDTEGKGTSKGFSMKVTVVLWPVVTFVSTFQVYCLESAYWPPLLAKRLCFFLPLKWGGVL